MLSTYSWVLIVLTQAETSNPKRRHIETPAHLAAFNQQTALEQVKDYFKGECY